MGKSLQKTASSFFNKKNLYFVLIGGVSFLFFGIFTLLVKADLLTQFDFNMTVRFQDYLSHHLRLQEYFCSLSIFGHFEVLIAILIGLLLFRRKWFGALVTIGFFGGAHIVEIIGKWMLHHPNPPQFFIKCHGPAFPSGYVQPGYSYPSGHAMRTVFIASVALYFILFSKRLNLAVKLILSIPIIGIVALMLISRISLGEHWPTDVIGGTLLGFAFSFFSVVFL